MSKVYTRQETIDAVKSAMNQPENLYKDKSLNWSGKTKDTHEYYTEVVSEEILNNLKQLKNISTITRNNSYKRDNHNEIYIKRDDDKEVQFAKRISGLEIPELGVIIDYQTPLKDSNNDKGLGKIDLISYNEENNTMYLVELKYQSDETMLRAMLESYTYFMTVDKTKLLKDYFAGIDIDIESVKVKPAVLMAGECQNAESELNDMECGTRRFEKALALLLNVDFYKLDVYVDTYAL